MRDAGKVFQVVELGPHKCQTRLDLWQRGELLGLGKVTLHRREHLWRVEERDELKRIGDGLATAHVGRQRLEGPHVVARAEVVRVERDGVVQLVVKSPHGKGDALVLERCVAEFGQQVLGVVILRIVEHAPHCVVDGPSRPNS